MPNTLKKSLPDIELTNFVTNDRVYQHLYSETTEVINNLMNKIYSKFGRLLKLSVLI